MFKTYQLKWCLWVIGVLLVSTFLLRQSMYGHFKIWEYIEYAGFTCSTVLTAWMINMYFIRRNFEKIDINLKHIISNIAAMIACTIVYYTFVWILPPTNLIDEHKEFTPFNRVLVHLIGFFFLSAICYIVLNYIFTNATLQKTKLENEMLKQAHLRAQLLSLQQQVSPHFLFNSLSTLKNLTEERVAKDYIVQLSKVYRHLLNFNEHHLTTLRDELAFLSSYIYILNQRFEDSLVVKMKIDEQYLSYSIPPLSLQLLVENAIKHNVASPEDPLQLNIYTGEDSSITIENNLSPKNSEAEGAGMGLQNINDRYELLVHKPIVIHVDPVKFSVTLPLLSV